MSAPRSSGRPASSGSANEKPATERPDPSVATRRRTAALAGHVGDPDTARGGLADPAPIVRSTALGALERLGALGDDELRAALADPSPQVRRRACELAASHPEVDLATAVHDVDPSVVEMAVWSLGERGEHASVPALIELAATGTGHSDPLCREAAVAALGAIGDRRGLPAVLSALEDKPAIRRRAAVALAAFDGPLVQAALHRCLDDRDWQVRQVAEDLLAVE